MSFPSSASNQRRAFFLVEKKWLCCIRRKSHKEERWEWDTKHVACLNKCCVESIVQTPLGGPHLSKVVTLHAIYSRLFGRVLEVAVEEMLVTVVMQFGMSAWQFVIIASL